MEYPRIMVAGIGSGTGKTTLSLGLMCALKRRQKQVQAFKSGPDYIDSALHTVACGRSAHNLDTWMMDPGLIKEVFMKNAQGADISIVEGVMGLFDGYRGERLKGSSAHLALMLKIPVILVVDAHNLSQSCVPLVKGFMDYQPGVNIKGVVLNRAGAFHREWVAPNLERELGVKVLGCIPWQEPISIPEGPLGLRWAGKNQELTAGLQQMADLIDEHIDLNQLLALAKGADSLDGDWQRKPAAKVTTIGVARDGAFCFYYQDSLDYLEELGAELKFFSPCSDEALPEVAGIYMGGGFPERFLCELSENIAMKMALQEVQQKGMPILAEGGAMMYLSRLIRDVDGKEWPGVGIIPADIQMSPHLQELGYIEATALADTLIASPGQVLRGHSFHYAILKGLGLEQLAFSLEGGMRRESGRGGYAQGSLLASFLHLQLRANPQAAHRFIKAASLYGRLLRD